MRRPFAVPLCRIEYPGTRIFIPTSQDLQGFPKGWLQSPHLAGPRHSLRIIDSLGLVAQSVEQRIENPCVGGSIPPRATKNQDSQLVRLFLYPFIRCRLKRQMY